MVNPGTSKEVKMKRKPQFELPPEDLTMELEGVDEVNQNQVMASPFLSQTEIPAFSAADVDSVLKKQSTEQKEYIVVNPFS